MKIAFLNIYSGINRRGAETFSHELANRLSEKHSVTFLQTGPKLPEQIIDVITIASPYSSPQEIFPKNVFKKLQKYLFLDSANRSVLIFTLKALPYILKNQPEVVIPMNGFWQVLLFKVFQPLKKYKILIIGHSGPGWDEKFNLYFKPNLFLATSLPTYDWAKKIAPWTKVKLIPYAIDESYFRQAKPENINLPKPIILCPAALVSYKRIDLAIKAVSRLTKVSLLVLGQGNLALKLQQLGKSLLQGRFLIKSVSPSQMPGYYQEVDLVTLPSSPQENSPLVFLESLAANKMVVTTDTPRNRWLLEDAAIYCDPEKTNEYCNALKEGLALSRRGEKIASIQKAIIKFNWQKVLKSYELALQSLH